MGESLLGYVGRPLGKGVTGWDATRDISDLAAPDGMFVDIRELDASDKSHVAALADYLRARFDRDGDEQFTRVFEYYRARSYSSSGTTVWPVLTTSFPVATLDKHNVAEIERLALARGEIHVDADYAAICALDAYKASSLVIRKIAGMPGGFLFASINPTAAKKRRNARDKERRAHNEQLIAEKAKQRRAIQITRAQHLLESIRATFEVEIAGELRRRNLALSVDNWFSLSILATTYTFIVKSATYRALPAFRRAIKAVPVLWNPALAQRRDEPDVAWLRREYAYYKTHPRRVPKSLMRGHRPAAPDTDPS